MTKIDYDSNGSNHSDFTCDELGIRARKSEASTVSNTKRFLCCGVGRCEIRDASGSLNDGKKLFGLGQTDSSTPTNRMYELDHTGSVVGLTDANGSEVTSISYDPYGIPSVLSGSLTPDFGFAGMYLHDRSKLNLTLFRQYNPSLGRWLSRDPIGEAGGLNLYGYAGNNPISNVDPLGLDPLEGSGPVIAPNDPGRELKMLIFFGEQLGGTTNPAQGAQYGDNATEGFYGSMFGFGFGKAGSIPGGKALRSALRSFGSLFPTPSTPVRGCGGSAGFNPMPNYRGKKPGIPNDYSQYLPKGKLGKAIRSKMQLWTGRKGSSLGDQEIKLIQEKMMTGQDPDEFMWNLWGIPPEERWIFDP